MPYATSPLLDARREPRTLAYFASVSATERLGRFLERNEEAVRNASRSNFVPIGLFPPDQRSAYGPPTPKGDNDQ